jgi:AcrR family transcriptional regulator
MRQEERRARTLAAVMNAAGAAFARTGYAETSLDAIAAEAHVSKGAVYTYYPTKLDLFLAVTNTVLEEAARRVERVGLGVALGQPPPTAAQRYLGEEGDSQHVALVTEVWRMAAVEEAVREKLETFRGERIAELGRHALNSGKTATDAMGEAEVVAKLIDAETLDLRLELATKLERAAS